MPEVDRQRARDSVANVLIVAIGVSLACSVLVSATAVLLKPQQERNQALYRQQIVLEVAGLYEPGADVEALFANIETELVGLGSGEDATVYIVRAGDDVDQVILPVHGAGLWSTMYGFLSLEPDGNTVRGLRFYEHAETPGLGDQVDKPEWRAQWPGKQLFGEDGAVRIDVVRGRVQPGPDAVHEVDGLSGATLTGRGVADLLRYWAGPQGFGSYLANLRNEDTGDG